MSRRTRNLLTLAAIVAAFVVLGILDRQASDKDHEQYCQMVHDNLWPDYNHSYATECK